jgi:membrane associated rhomboid family serine protease
MCDEMLEDRYYMRDEERSSRFSATAILMIVLTVIFALQQINIVYFRSFDVHGLLALHADGLRQGWLWQLVTFQFLHVGVFHLIFNLLVIWFCGRAVEARLGTANFLKIYFASGVVGGLLQSILMLLLPQYFGTGPVLGASAGACGLIAAFALIEPEATFLFMFIFPMKARHMLIIMTAIAAFFTLVPSTQGVAHAAHLGGIAAGYAFMKWGLYNYSASFRWHPFRNRARRRQLVKAATVKPGFWRSSKAQPPEEVEPEEFISREVDPILDKISAHGMQSLTPREKQILEAARAKMDKR